MSKIFPKSANKLPLQIIIFLFVLVGVVTAATTYYATPKYTRVGYAPIQPVPYSHALHAGQLGIDCRYCHSNVEKSGVANLPTAQTCMNCHSHIKTDSPLLAPARATRRVTRSTGSEFTNFRITFISITRSTFAAAFPAMSATARSIRWTS